MGGALGNPISDYDQQRINDTINEVLVLFAVEFSKEYTQAVVMVAKNELDPPHNRWDDCKLQMPPMDDEIVKTGMLTKRGDSTKSWKPRFFTAFNANENYKIEYRDGTDQKGKLKGTIHCAGYEAREFTEEDIIEQGGEKGIKLVPHSWRRRTWWIKCPDDEERKAWMEVFENACYEARPPQDPDKAIAHAFTMTIKKLRWHFWVWTYGPDAGSEDERLGEFVLDLLDRNIVQRILDDIPSSSTKSAVCDLVRKTIGGSVKGACSSAWTSGVTAVRSCSASVQENVTKMITPIVEAEVKFKQTIMDLTGPTTKPTLADKGGEMLSPVLAVMVKPITDAFKAAALGFHKAMSARLADGDFAGDKFATSLREAKRDVTYRWGDVNRGAYDVLYDMCHSDIAKLASLFSPSISVYNIYNLASNWLKVIMKRAVYTFGQLAKDMTDMTGVLAHVTSMLFHDCMIMVEVVVTRVFDLLLAPFVTEFIMKPCKELVEPIQEQIAAIPGMDLLLDLPTLLEQVIEMVVKDGINTVIGASLGSSDEAIEAAAVTIGLSSQEA